MKSTNFSPVFIPALPGFRNALYILLCLAGQFLFVDLAQGQTNTWDGSTDNKWHVASNWSLDTIPMAWHDVVIDKDVAIEISTGTSPTINSLSITNTSIVSFTANGSSKTITIDNTGSIIEAGSALTLNGEVLTTRSVTIQFTAGNGTMDINGDLILTAVGGGGKYVATNSITNVTGLVKNDGTGGGSAGTITSAASNLTFDAGSTYQHALNSGTIPTATWHSTSTCLISGTTSTHPGGGAQAFGNLIYNCPGMTSGVKAMTSGSISIGGNFEILNTGAASLGMNTNAITISGDFTISDDFIMVNNSTARTLNILGDFTLNSGLFTVATNTSGKATLNVTGNFSVTGGTMAENSTSNPDIIFNNAGTQIYTSGATITNSFVFLVNAGCTLLMADPSTTVGGTGSFTLLDGATLGVSSVEGIAVSGATGHIRTNSRTFEAGSNIIYNGTADQITGTGLAAGDKANLLIDNPGNTVTLSGTTVISGTLTVTAGSTFNLSSYAFSVPTEVFLECGALAGSDIAGTGQLTLGGNITLTDAAGAGTDGAIISCPISLGSNRTFTVVDDGSSAADLTISGAISGLFGMYKDGAGTLKLSGANTYSGATTINAGTIVLDGAAERISNTSALALNGGTFSTGETVGYSESMYTLTLTDNATIDLGTGSHTLSFANSSGVSWLSGKVLTIAGWTGTIESSGSGTQGKILVGVGGLSTAQLAQIQFSGYPAGAVITPSGELVPKAKVFYSTSSSTPETPGNWNTNRDGSGTAATATDFTNAGTFFVVQGSGNGGSTPHTMTTSATWAVSGSSSKIQVESGASLIAPFAITLGTDGVFQVDNGATYKHQHTDAWATTIFQGLEIFGNSSTIEINKTATTLPSNASYGNLIINLTDDPGADLSFNGNLTTVHGSLTVTNTQSRELRLTSSTSPAIVITNHFALSGAASKVVLTAGSGSPVITVNGNATISNGILDFGGSGSTGSSTLSIKGNFTHTGGVIARTGSGSSNAMLINGSGMQTIESIGFDDPNSIAFTVAPTGSGQVEIAAAKSFIATGSALFTISNTSSATELVVNGTLATGTTLVNSGSVALNGTMQLNSSGSVTGTSLVYGSSSLLVYNATASPYNVGTEWTGNAATAGLGVPQNVTIQNTNVVTMPNTDRGIAGQLTLTSGALTLNATSGNLFVGGNWSRSGATFTPNGRKVSFNGAVAQTIGGSSPTTFFDLEIANTSGGVSLSAPATVDGTLTLTNGILTTDAVNLLTVTNTSPSAVSAGSASRFVKGPLKWTLGTGTYLFPVGKSSGNYFPFTLALSAASSPVITVEAFDSDAGAGATFDGTLSGISHTEYWKAVLHSGSYTGKVSLTRITALGDEDGIGQSASQAGSYSLIGGTASSPSIVNSNDISTAGYFVMSTSFKKCPISTAVAPAADQAVCQGFSTNQLTATITTSSGIGTPVFQYQWYYNTTNSNTVAGATLISGATAQIYTPLSGAPEAGTTRYYFCVGYATNNSCIQTNATQFLASNPVKVTVNALPACSITGPDPVCPSSLANAYSGPGGLSYAWSISGSGSIPGSTTSQSVAVDAAAGCNTSFTLYLTVTDANGCTSTCTKMVSVIDNTPPSLTGMPYAGTTGNNACKVNAAAAAPFSPSNAVSGYTDNCGGTLTAELTNTSVTGDDCNWTVTYTYSVKDVCNNTLTNQSYSNTGSDQTAPSFTGAPYSGTTGTNACKADAATAAPFNASNAITGYTDNCLGTVTAQLTNTTVTGDDCSWTVTYTFSVKDICNNTLASQSYSNTGSDQVAPSWTTAAGALDVTKQCSDAAGIAAAQAMFPVAADNCDADVTNIVKTSGAFVAGSCPEAGSYTNTWVVTDQCGNTSAVYTQVITIIDNTAPTWSTAAGALDITKQCSDAAGIAAAQAMVPIATDNCDGNVTNIVKTSGAFVAGACPEAGTYTNTWVVTDNCGNTSAVYTQVITIIDNTAPTWTTTAGSLNVTKQCSDAAGIAAAQGLFPVAADNCDADVTNIVKTSGAFIAGSCPEAGTYTNTWVVTDACGNTSAVFTQVISITDNTAPTWTTAAGALHVTKQCSDAAGIAAAQAMFPVASDNCDTDVSDIVKTSGAFVAGTCPEAGTYTNTWVVTDNCGNASTVYTQVITIIDNTAPTWTTAAGALNVTKLCSDVTGIAEAQAMFPVASDNCDGNVSDIVKSSGAFVAGACPEAGTYTNTWVVTDNCGNTSAMFTQVITIIDNEAPVWTTSANALNVTKQCSDAAGIAAAQALFPVASDNCDGNVDNIVKTSGAFVPGACPEAGTYTNTWLVTDNCGNTSAVYTQVITLIDNTAPTWTTAAGALNMTKQCSDAAGIAAAQAMFPVASDNCDGDVTNIVKTSGVFVPGACPEAGTYTNTWVVTDNCGNTSAVYTQVITISDNTAPTWVTASSALNATKECSDLAGIAAAQALFPVANDNCDSDVTNIVKTSGAFVAGACPEAGTYTNTWVLTDNCGNTSAVYTQTITIIDNTAPTWTTAAGALNVTKQCSDATGIAEAQAMFPVAADNCDASVIDIVKTSGAYVAGSCPEAGTYTNTWVVTDNCGNTSAVYTQVITIIDDTPPTWTTAAGALDVTRQCSDIAGIAAAQAMIPAASDLCDGDVSNIVKTAGAFVAGSCPEAGTYTNTWVVTDNCGNTSAVYTQVITIIDNTAPTWSTAAGALHVTKQCSDVAGIAAAQAMFPVASDLCDSDVSNIVKTAGAFVPGTCPEAGTYTNTWVVTDNCGNTSAVYTQVITITDNTSPTWVTAEGALNVTRQCSDAAGIADAQSMFPIANDNCDAIVTDIVKTSGAFVAGTCPEAGTYTNTWVVTDNCGNTSSIYTQVITIIDDTAPTWTTAPGALNVTIQCSDIAGIADAQALFPAASDNCDSDVSDIVKTSGAFVPGGCPEAGTYTNTWVVTDNCSNTSAVYTQVITIIDNTAPTWTTTPGALDVTRECSDASGIAEAQAMFPVATDNCDPGVLDIVKTAGAFVPGACPEAGTYTNTWVVTDNCGNTSAAYTQVITIVDNTAPTWTTIAGALHVTKQCSDAAGIAEAQAMFPVANDNCDPSVTDVVKTSGAFVPGACPEAGTYTNTWVVTDNCGNTSLTYTQVITIVDNTAPAWITAAGVLNVTKQCSDAIGIAEAQAMFPIAADNCDADVTDIIKTSGAFVAGSCPESGTYTNTWVVTDNCGNTSAVYTQVITIIDNTAPTWTTASGALDITKQCSDVAGIASAQAMFPVAVDNCDANVTNIVKTSGAYVEGLCPESGTYTNTWVVTDDCGNTSNVFTQVITIIDNTAPTWTTSVGALDVTRECSDAAGIADAQAMFPVATDNCDMSVTDIVKTTGTFVAGACPEAGTYTNTWVVTDNCGNTSVAYTQVITITDNTAPTWTTVAGALNVTRQCSDAAGIAEAQALFPVASDNCDANVTDIVKTSGAFVAGACPEAGTYTNTWVVTDNCGNTSNVFTQVITILDNTPPTWTTAAGDLDVTRQCSDASGIADAQAMFPIASDNCDLNVSDIVKTSGAFVAGSCPQAGTYTNTWVVTDNCGNTSAVYTQVITIIDNTPPTWTTAAGALHVTRQCNDVAGIADAQSLFPVAMDNCDASVVDIVKTSGAFVAGACPEAGTYTNTWVVTDDCGNTSSVYTQVITIIDNTAPTWTTAAGMLNVTKQCSDAIGIAEAQALFPEASDNCDGDVTDIVKTSGAFVAGACPEAGTYTNTWVVTDNCGNTSLMYTQVITIIDDTAPTWTTAAGALNVTKQCSDASGIADAQAMFPIASDNCDLDVSDIVKTSGAFVAGTCPEAGTYTNTWVVTDNCGNTSEVYTQVITLIDNTAPTWTTASGALDITKLCSDAAGIADAQAMFPIASDNCDANVTTIVKTSGAYVPGACPEAGTYTNTWVVTDNCGNTSEVFTQVITIIDNTPPSWTTSAGALDMTLQCSDLAGIADAQAMFPVASDNCDPNVTNIVKTSGIYVQGTCPEAGTYTNTWVVTDNCGNTSDIFTQVISIIDDTAPTWTTVAGALNVTKECSDATGIAEAQAMFPVASDNCDPGVMDIVKTSGAFVAGTCPEAGTYTNTWVVTDNCGNTSNVFTQTITIVDITAPTWTTAEGALNVTKQCSDAAGIAEAQAMFPVAGDNCDVDVSDIAKTSGAFVAGSCPETGTYTNTWVVTDNCGNTSDVYTQTITIIDNTPPTWTTIAGALNVTKHCSDAVGIAEAQAMFPIASDNCDVNVSNIVKTYGAFIAGSCPEAGTFTNTWVVTDNCGNTSDVYTQVITIIDNTAPTWTTAPGTLDVIKECSDAMGIAEAQGMFPVAIDNCDASVTDIVKTSGVFVAGACPEAGTYTNSWVVTDNCGNTSLAFTQVITIIDDTAPTWTTPVGALNLTKQCSDAAGIAEAQALFPVASDNCDSDVTNIIKTSGAFVPGTCPEAGTFTNTWVVTDNCGNTSNLYTQVITIIDNLPPTWTTPAGALDITKQCSDAAGIAAAQALFPVASDLCDGDVSNVVKTAGAFVAGACPEAGTYTNTWVVTDNCGNISATYTQVITIIDDTAPAWTTAPGDLNVTKQCSDFAGIAEAQALFPVASDNCDPNVANIVKTAGSFVSGTCPEAGTYTNTWVVTDDCGNTSDVYTQVITIIDNTPPAWSTLPGALNVTLQCSDPAGLIVAQAQFPVAADNCDPDVSGIVKIAGAFVPGTCAQSGTYTNTWTVEDNCGNTSAVYTQVITIIDNIAPTWTTINGALNVTKQCSDVAGIAEAQAMFPVANDNCDTDVSNIVKTTGAFVAGACPQSGTYTNTWVVADDCGNTSAVYTQVITIIDDTSPTWTSAAGSLDVSVQCSDVAGIALAQALFPIAGDNCDVDVTNLMKTPGVFVSGACPEAGTYTNTWVVFDDCGNTSPVFTQVITIVDDLAPEWVTVEGALNVTKQCSDAAGIADAQTLFPVAIDNCDNDLTDIFKTGGAFVPGLCPEAGTYTNTWTITDNCGNTSAVYTQVITVIDDEAPTWNNGQGELDITLECSDVSGIAEAQDWFPGASDICDGDVTDIVEVVGAFVPGPCGQAGTYTNTWTVTDNCGNTSDVFTQVITITDNAAPEWFTSAGVLDVTVQCSDVAGIAAAQAMIPVAMDNCDGDLLDIVKTAGIFVPGSCPEAGTYTNTWVVTDDCGNTSDAYTQVITIIDNIAPVWSTANGALHTTVQCDDPAGLAAAQALFPVATDNCDGVVTNIIKTSGAFVVGSCPESGTYTNTWTVTDNCGNQSAAYTQVITVIDNTTPTWTTLPGALNVSAQCSDAAAIAAAQAMFPVAADNCDGDVSNIIRTAGAFVAGICPEAGTYTNTWTVTDNCGNTSLAYTQVITIIDDTAPTWTTAPGALDVTRQCSDAAGIATAQAMFPVAGDNCDEDVSNIVKTSGAYVSGTCPEAGSYTNTWTVTDDCGNTSILYTQVITIIDDTAPVWVTEGGALNVTLQCSDVAGIAAAQEMFPVAGDNCDGDVSNIVKTSGVYIPGACPETGNYTNTWTVTDNCGNISEVFIQVISIIDNTAPAWSTAPGALDITKQCSDVSGITDAQAMFPMASDNCDTDVSNIVKVSGSFVPGACPEAGTYTNTWTVTDNCGNVSEAFTQIITIIDDTAPVWTSAPGALNVTRECSDAAGIAAAQAMVPVASDDCDGDLTDLDKLSGAFISGACPEAGTYTNTWTVTDNCGNVSEVYTQIITIIDNTAPVWATSVDALNVTRQCSDAAGIAAAQAMFPVASDNCDSDVTNLVKVSGAYIPGTCPEAGTYTNTWTVTDNCGNVSEVFTQVITIIDNTAPTWTTIAGALNVTRQCSDVAGIAAAQAMFPVASDNCDGDVSNIVKTSGSYVPGACPEAGTYTNTWTVTDNCGNTSEVFTQTITIIDDTAPTWTTMPGALDVTAECSDLAGYNNAQAMFPVASDNCDGDVTNIVKTSGFFVGGDCPEAGTFTNTWVVTDNCGNVSETFTQVITIIDDTAPVWTTAPGALDITKQCNDAMGIAEAQMLFPAATDNCDGNVSNIVKVSGAFVAGTCPEAGTYTNTWTVTDNCGNVSEVFTQVITIIDNTAPVWSTSAGALNVTRECSDVAGIAAAQAMFPLASDNCDADVSNIVKVSGAYVPGACPEAGSYTNTWTVTDNCGNVSEVYTQVITIIDNTAPVWSTAANALNTTKQCSDVAGIADAQAMFPVAGDNCDGDVSNIIKTSGAYVPGSCPEAGTYTNTWTVTDNCGNISDVYTQVITIIDDTAPTWSTVAGALHSTQQCSDVAGIAAAQAMFPVASDNCDGDVSDIVKIAGAFVPGTCPEAGTYTNTWTVTDNCGNTSEVFTQIITIIDNTAPVWSTAPGALDITKQCSDASGIADAQAMFPVASDNCDGDVSNIVKVSGAFVAGTCPEAGTFTNTWTVTDNCGNVSEVFTQVITIIDNTAPVWTTSANALDVTRQCSDIAGIAAAQAMFPLASDNCDADVSNIVKVAGAYVPGACPEAGSYTNTWTVTDNCGNVSEVYTQVITIIDNTAPVWSTAANALNTTKQCSDVAGIADAQAMFPVASDNCDGDVSNIIKTSGAYIPGTCPEAGTYTNTWTVTDNCGNISDVYTQVIT
jgi:autotransporter-associated beta strand protein